MKSYNAIFLIETGEEMGMVKLPIVADSYMLGDHFASSLDDKHDGIKYQYLEEGVEL